MQDLKVTLVQTHLHWQNKEANRKHFSDLLKQVTDTDLIVLPEMFNTGFSMETHSQAESMNGDSVKWMIKTAVEKKVVLLGSMIIQEEHQFFNRLIVAYPDGAIDWYDKRHLFRMAGENQMFTGGMATLLFTVKGWKIKPFVCYDLRFPVWVRNRFDKTGKWEYDIAIYIANWPSARTQIWKTLASARAIENQSYVIALNRIGTDGNGLHYSGASQVINSSGESLILSDEHEYVKTISLEYQSLLNHRTDFPVGMDMDEFTIL